MQSQRTTISFLTQNQHKFLEAREALSQFSSVILEQLDEDKHENKDDSVADALREIAVTAAVNAAKSHNKIVVAEDSGIFFEAYDDFPGMNTKWIIKKIGYDGILRLLLKKNRGAYFRTVLAMSNPNGDYKVFEGVVKGSIAEQVYGIEVDCMDYDRIFIPHGSEVPFALMMKDKRAMSHRYIAFHKLGEFLSSKGVSNV